VEKTDTTYIIDDQAAGLKSDATCKIDVHAHYLPPGYADELRSAGVICPDGMPGYPEWSPQRALETYDRLGIITGVLSISSPGVHYGDDAAAIRLARRVNEAGADTVADFPTRFGLFAELPMPNVEGSLKEIAYALDGLHADGIALKTNARGIYGRSEVRSGLCRIESPQSRGLRSSDLALLLEGLCNGLPGTAST
jgi:hypothetical protein